MLKDVLPRLFLYRPKLVFSQETKVHINRIILHGQDFGKDIAKTKYSWPPRYCQVNIFLWSTALEEMSHLSSISFNENLPKRSPSPFFNDTSVPQAQMIHFHASLSVQHEQNKTQHSDRPRGGHCHSLLFYFIGRVTPPYFQHNCQVYPTF